MDQFLLTNPQLQVIQSPTNRKVFLSGLAGTGKTTSAINRLRFLIDQGIPGNSILLLVPQRTLAAPYQEILSDPGSGGLITYLTFGGMARRMIDLFWPVIAESTGFGKPDQPPVFLTLETAQYYIARIVYPLLEQGYFSSVSMDRNRLLSQIIDNLNKSAVVGFPHTQIAQKLVSAWTGDPGQARIYEDAQYCASSFRSFCLQNNLLDFSLQLEIFRQHLWQLPECRKFLNQSYQHIICDNLEEDTPISHDLLREWLPEMASALLIVDQEAGFRRFLGSDPVSAQTLTAMCDEQVFFEESFSMEEPIRALHYMLSAQLSKEKSKGTLAGPSQGMDNIPSALSFQSVRFFPQMLDWVAGTIASLIHEGGVPPREIAVLSPFLSDALRFSLSNRLSNLGVPNISHRPSRSLRDEPATRCLITLALLAHPDWLAIAPRLRPTKYDVAYAFLQAISGLDLIRAQLLVEVVYRLREGLPTLTSFDSIQPSMQDRITYTLGEPYEYLRRWIEQYQSEPSAELDHFLRRLFGEVLTQPGFGFHTNFTAGEITANLIESIQKFRWASDAALGNPSVPLGVDYLEMVQDGVISAQYIRSWQIPETDSVLLAPAYTFLMSNRPVNFQFWIDIGNRSWSERLYQPLTHPFVLSRNWLEGQLWTDADEVDASQESLSRLALGLLRRCRKKLFLGLSELNEQGFEQRGFLLSAFQRVLRSVQG